MLYLTVHLYRHPEAAEAFRAYERKALDLFRRHGGEVVAAFSPERGTDPEGPDEIQILRIADRARFESFLADPARQAWAAEREAAVRRTETFVSRALIEY
jgi:uncharacterized protein (DUF1330 family)